MKLATFIASHAQYRPLQEALVCGTRRMTFRELHEASSRLASSLREEGVAVGDRIAIYLPNCIEFVTAFAAIIKAGAIAVPINMRLSVPEIAFILQDTAPQFAFLFAADHRSFLNAAQGISGLRCILVEGRRGDDDLSLPELVSRGAATPPETPPEFDDCMISYTSGTTGKPKGAILTQANYIVMSGFLHGLQFGISDSDRMLVTTPLAHRTAFARVGNLIVHGCTLVILPKFDAQEVARRIEAERITMLSMVPTVGRMLLSEFESRPERFASLRAALVTGEAFPVELKKRIQDALPQMKLYSFFAMTEAGVLAMLMPDEQLTHPMSVGRVIPGVELRLTDDEGRDVAYGEVGEIWCRTGEPGRYLTMRCYYNRPDATREAFRDGWFATGDMGRIDAEGYLYIVDRKKDMVLSGGYNIYSKEVEAVLLQHPAVQDAAVIAVPDPIFGEAVAAFIERRSGASVSSEDLVTWCTSQIASYKKPKHVHFVDALPRNSTGKVLKHQIRERFAREFAPSAPPQHS